MDFKEWHQFNFKEKKLMQIIISLDYNYNQYLNNFKAKT